MAIELPLVLPFFSNNSQTLSSAFRSPPPSSSLTAYGGNNSFRQLQDIFIFRIYNFAELDQHDIDKRAKIYMTFLTHTQKFLLSLLQHGSFNSDKSIFQGENFAVMTKHRHGIPVGAWEMRHESQGQYQTTRHSDIIALYAFAKDTSYKKAIHILSEHIETNSNFYTASQSKAGWFIQEKYPISVYEFNHYNDFIDGLKSQIDHRNMRLHNYKNKFGMHIATKIEYINNSGKQVTVFYTIQRRHDSPLLYFVPVPPEPPYMIHNIEKITERTKDVIFHKCEDVHYNFSPYDIIHVACSLSLKHLAETDFSELYGKNIFVEWDGTPLEEGYLLRLKKM